MASSPTTVQTASTARPTWINALVAWQAAVTVGLAITLVLLLTGRPANLVGFGKWVAAIFTVLLTLASAYAVAELNAVRHRGRLLGLLINYLVAVGAGFFALQEMKIFVGLDAVGESFGNAVPFVILLVVGWLVGGWATRFPSQAKLLRTISRWTVLASAAIVLLVLGVLPGVIEFVSRLIDPLPLLMAAITALAATATWFLLRAEAGTVFGTTKDQDETMAGILFVSPNVLGFLAFFLGPLLFSLYISFTDWDAFGDKVWIGLDNYTRLFSLQFVWTDSATLAQDVLKTDYLELWRIGPLLIGARDILFWTSLRNVIVFGLMAVPLSIVPALVLAALLNAKLPGVKFFRAVYFLPSIAGVVGVALIWKQLYNASVGFINYGLVRLFDLINLLPGLDLSAPQPEWLSSSSTALFSVVVVFAWQLIGFNTVLFLAGMQGISKSLYEAASIDGAGPVMQFRKITVPMLAPTMVYVVATTTILALQLFNEPFILMAPQQTAAGPANATLSPVIYLVQQGFTSFNQGYASAIGWVLFIIIFGITLIYFRRQGEEGVLST